MIHFYLLPIERNVEGTAYGPKYCRWRFDPDPPALIPNWSGMDYGFMSAYLIVADVTDTLHASIAANADVYSFPSNLDQAIPGNDTLQAFCEGINIPTNWVTASTTYRELMRCLAGIFQFAQRYYGIAGESLFSGTVTLSTRYRNLSAQRQAWFNATVESFGYPSSIINQNSTFRQMLKLAGDAWGAAPFDLGGVLF